MDISDKLVEIAEKHWHKPLGLAVSSLIVVSILTPLVLAFEGNSFKLSVLAVALLLVFAFWVASRRIEKTPKDKLGFAVAIRCDDRSQRSKVKEDFVATIRALLRSGSGGDRFHFIDLPQFVARNISDQAQAGVVRRKCRAHFLIYGQVRLRDVNGGPHHVFELNGQVVHSPLAENVQTQFSREFAELWPSAQLFPTDNDLFAFKFTSEITAIVSRYIIGIAAFLSGDWDYAENLYRDVGTRLAAHKKGPPIFEKIGNRLPLRLDEINWSRASRSFRAWKESHSQEYADATYAHFAKNTTDIAPVWSDFYASRHSSDYQ